jgi:hypothetical protein
MELCVNPLYAFKASFLGTEANSFSGAVYENLSQPNYAPVRAILSILQLLHLSKVLLNYDIRKEREMGLSSNLATKMYFYLVAAQM